ncbi:MAG TPA: TatD family hydrolase, partial [Longimicrobium sp.]|nr:TatD family hydrolase [Longimicrobium sp.]
MIDSHAHLADERILPDVAAVVQRAREAGLAAIVSIATQPDDLRVNLGLAERFDDVWATAGIHPHSASTSSPQSASFTSRPPRSSVRPGSRPRAAVRCWLRASAAISSGV